MRILLIHQYFLEKGDGGGSRFNEMTARGTRRAARLTGDHRTIQGNIMHKHWKHKEIHARKSMQAI